MRSTKSFCEIIKEMCNENIVNTTIETRTEDKIIKMTVTLDHANYGNYLYWRVVCDTPITALFDHPLRKCDADDIVNGNEVGEVVADNELIRMMIKFLAMPDKELRKYSGNVAPIGYRACILASLTQFWD